jgi:hypothetical protein
MQPQNMPIRIIDDFISIQDLKQLAKERFGDMVKAVVDLDKGIMVVGAELHADEEAVLLEHGSNQENLWGFNIYVDEPRESWLEYNSMINIRPSQNNPSRDIQNKEIQNRIIEVVNKLVK